MERSYTLQFPVEIKVEELENRKHQLLHITTDPSHILKHMKPIFYTNTSQALEKCAQKKNTHIRCHVINVIR